MPPTEYSPTVRLEICNVRSALASRTALHVKGFGRRPIATAREGTGAVVRKRPVCPKGDIPRDRGACLAGNRHAPYQNNARSGKSRMDWFVRRCVKLT